jgi:Divergent InlB B-repeat domain
MFRRSLKSCMPFVFLLMTAAYFPTVPALAASIDFTDSLYSDCNGQTSCEKTVGGIKVRIEGWNDADPKDGVLDPLVDTPAPLSWEPQDVNGYHDGFGVRTGELDEIERPEFLVVRFLNAGDPGGPGNWHYVKHMLSELNLTNLFYENGYLERGAYKFTVNGVDGGWVSFEADSGQVIGTTNGVLDLPVPTPPSSDELADYITFTAPEPGYTIPPGENHEFSLAGLNALAIYTLSVSRVGTGGGTVTSDPAGINCGLVCTKLYDTETDVALTATPDAGSTFSGWSGDCDESGQVTLDADKGCTATFTLDQHTLTITTAGNGSGSATGGGTYNYGDTATVMATPDPGSTVMWSGPDGAECATGSVLMNASKSCTATFTLNSYTLTLTTSGGGSGSVSGAGTYDYGQTASVSATADPGSTFTGWTGTDAAECSTGSVSMTSDKSCTATFTLNAYALTIVTAGSGSGTTAGAGIYNYGQTASVSATADPGSTFTGWTGSDGTECGTGSVLMDANKSCTANFTLNSYTLTLTTAGSGSGALNGSGTYNYGQTASVSATADPGSTFTGWSGSDGAECGTGSVLMDANKSCTATFDEILPPAGDPVPARIYFSNQDTDNPTVVVMDPDSTTILGSIPVNGVPGELVGHPDGTILYVVVGSDLSVIDVATNQELTVLTDVGDTFNLLAMSPDGSKLYLIYRQIVPATLILKVFDTTDPTTPTLMTTVSNAMFNGCYGALGLAVSPDGSQLYMACRIGAGGNPDRFYMIDTATYTPTQTATYPRENSNYMFVNALAVTPDGSTVYIARAHSAGSTVEYFNATTGARQGAIALPANAMPRAGAFTPDGSKLYVTDQVLGTHVINPATHTRTTTLPQSKSRGLDIAMTADAHAYTTLLFEIHDLNAANNTWAATIGGDFSAAYQITATPGHP